MSLQIDYKYMKFVWTLQKVLQLYNNKVIKIKSKYQLDIKLFPELIVIEIS